MTLKDSVSRSVRAYLCSSVYYSVYYAVSRSVRAYLCSSVYYSVHNSVYSSVAETANKIEDLTSDTINEYITK